MPAFAQSAGAGPEAAEADSVHDQLVLRDVVDLDAERAHGIDRRLRVAGAEEAAHVRLPSPSAPSSTERWEIDLSPGTATCPLTSAAGSIFTRWCGP